MKKERGGEGRASVSFRKTFPGEVNQRSEKERERTCKLEVGDK